MFLFTGLQEYLDQVSKNGMVAEIRQLKLTIRDCETHLEKAKNQIVLIKKVCIIDVLMTYFTLILSSLLTEVSY